MLFVLIALLAWGTLFIRMPRWCRGLLALAFVGSGVLMVLFGGFAWYWDAHMRPGAASSAKVMTICGVLVLASRVWTFIKAVADDSV